MDAIYKDLKEKHDTKFDVPKLRLWARMIATDLHDDYNDPPNIPAFSGLATKKPRKDSMYEALTGAAEAFAKVITSSGEQERATSKSSTSTCSSRISPSKSIELRMKNFEQLRYLQQLLDDGILNEREYAEQKQTVINSLRKLSE